MKHKKPRTPAVRKEQERAAAAAYLTRMKKQGYAKVCVFVPAELAGELKAFAVRLRGGNKKGK